MFLADIDRIRWRQELQQDRDTIAALLAEVQVVDAARDAKLAKLKEFLRDKVEHPTNDGNRKALVFTAFSDTADYLYEHVAPLGRERTRRPRRPDHRADNRATLRMKRTHMIDVLTAFSPRSKGGDPDFAADRHRYRHRHDLRRAEPSGLRHGDQLRHPLEPRAHRPALRARRPARHDQRKRPARQLLAQHRPGRLHQPGDARVQPHDASWTSPRPARRTSWMARPAR